MILREILYGLQKKHGLTELSHGSQYEELVNTMRQLYRRGQKPMYKQDYNAKEPLYHGFRDYKAAEPSVHTAVEPIGYYWGNKLKDITPLRSPGSPQMDVGYFRYLRGLHEKFVTGVELPGTKHREFGPVEWEKLLLGLQKDLGGSKGLIPINKYVQELEGVHKNIGKSMQDELNEVYRPYMHQVDPTDSARKLTKILVEDMGLDSVSFPDTVAYQPGIMQKVTLTHGNTLTRWKDGTTRGGGLLGIVAAPKFFNWESKEQGSSNGEND